MFSYFCEMYSLCVCVYLVPSKTGAKYCHVSVRRATDDIPDGTAQTENIKQGKSVKYLKCI